VITKREQQIIDLHEDGAKAQQIAEELELSLEYVQGRIRTLCHGCGPDDRHYSDMAQSSRQLRDAVILSRDTTPEQLRVLCFIHGYQMANKGATPTVADVAASLEMSKAAAFESIHALKEIGALRVRGRQHRHGRADEADDSDDRWCAALRGRDRQRGGGLMPAPLPWQSTTVRTARLSSWRLRLGCTPREAARSCATRHGRGAACAAPLCLSRSRKS
jgi:biotin operon repressor